MQSTKKKIRLLVQIKDSCQKAEKLFPKINISQRIQSQKSYKFNIDVLKRFKRNNGKIRVNYNINIQVKISNNHKQNQQILQLNKKLQSIKQTNKYFKYIYKQINKYMALIKFCKLNKLQLIIFPHICKYLNCLYKNIFLIRLSKYLNVKQSIHISLLYFTTIKKINLQSQFQFINYLVDQLIDYFQASQFKISCISERDMVGLAITNSTFFLLNYFSQQFIMMEQNHSIQIEYSILVVGTYLQIKNRIQQIRIFQNQIIDPSLSIMFKLKRII
ncbi:hypothetical protein TTHERM_000140891 (macronuclear) [Tetrahymena thermophila SB210]|uniref:Uncharacterized protein n=1 Tax=Tetrahymena thermophila (strain SB210) TaxID=312017 RepID=W7XJL5_TETTS|nr:hypothetical protein TTHERM_000140891 [Tetrahymena thermophila SB210]EWS75641.1 hypothetical protein TTHERM_000140891 [Tetrahymena thermophila SB210]|eukprot:XP_012651787.1 hypothetical protein TTHERM_000140891 [Tetrahymena thermophila SB210]